MLLPALITLVFLMSLQSAQFPPQSAAQWQALRQSLAATQGKNYGGTRGDSAAINWALAILEIGAATTIIVFSFTFLSAMGTLKGRSEQNFSTAYYCAQFVLGLAILTVTIFTLYVLWVFADRRHPMRKAWVKMAERPGNAQATATNVPGQVQNADGKAVPFPGMWTSGFEGVNRLTTDRLYAERGHIQKMAGLYGVLFVAWFSSFMILTLANGYVTWTKNKNNYNIRVAQVCPKKKTHGVCWELAKTGISCGVISLLFLLNLIVAVVALMARPKFSTTQKNGLVNIPDPAAAQAGAAPAPPK